MAGPEREGPERVGHGSDGGPTGDDLDGADLEGLVVRALEGLPEPFRDQLGGVAIVIEDEPTPAQLASVGVRGLFGLYQGVPRTRFGADSAAVPSKITIFAGPLRRAHRSPDALAAGVADTVYHEIAHHFGISDARLHELKGPRR
jgi:predicted Zn-dependent protease with MMP-like domain